MLKRAISFSLVVLIINLIAIHSNAQDIKIQHDQNGVGYKIFERPGDSRLIKIYNRQFAAELMIKDKKVVYELLYPISDETGKEFSGIFYQPGFMLDLTWTDWRAPGKANNGDISLQLYARDFAIDEYHIDFMKDSSLYIDLIYCHDNLHLKMKYTLANSDFFMRKSITLTDTLYRKHFWEKVEIRSNNLKIKQINGSDELGLQMYQVLSSHDDIDLNIIKDGGFGQPVAVSFSNNGAFFGYEYPASTNKLNVGIDGSDVILSAHIGKKITNQPLSTENAVFAVTPEKYVKKWFFNYVDKIRVNPLKPYTLYNSWYDLRSPEYPRVPEQNHMNVANINRIIELFKKNMIDKYQIQLDAFVLDDGWDVYESDWKLREPQFPDGLKTVADDLDKINSGLGIWYGPTGGYSFRMKRIDWMGNHGFERVGKEVGYNEAMLCFGGESYSKLFRDRVVDMVKYDDVQYFKWDGFQFSCSEPDHGHPQGIHSRRAILEELFTTIDTVRSLNNNIFLNITSGTWLSPWWVMYANTIWMDAADYGYANVPSINKRDAAITYRDIVLYDDFKNKELWFPIANLMTHGIIKGKLQMLGGTEEPINKFTDNALLYFARGVAMYELYISPDMLSDQEWEALSKSISWAKDRFSVLMNTYMIGGNPAKGESYGYAHFKDDKGIVAVRNPVIDKQPVIISLNPELGLCTDAEKLVVERVYPDRYIYPDLYQAGDSIETDLEGFETAIYEIYPIQEATKPLVAGAVFDISENSKGGNWLIDIYDTQSQLKILNKEIIKKISYHENKIENLNDIPISKRYTTTSAIFLNKRITNDKLVIKGDSRKQNPENQLQIAILLKTNNQSSEKDLLPEITVRDGSYNELKTVRESNKNNWAWYSFVLPSDQNEFDIEIDKSLKKVWKGSVELYVIENIIPEARTIRLTTSRKYQYQKELLPPKPFGEYVNTATTKIGEYEF